MKKLILLVLTVICFGCFSMGCEAGNKKEAELSGFEIKNDTTEELGSVYTVEKPFVYDADKNYYAVSVIVTHNGAVAEVIGGLLELNEIGEYVITYSVNVNGKIVEKTTTVKVEDNIAPTIAYGDIPNTVKVGDAVDISNITAKDNSGVEVFEKKVVDGDGNTVTLINDGFVADKKGIYTINVVAQDKNGNRTEENYKIEALEESQIYNFNTESELVNFGIDDRYCSELQIVQNVQGSDGGCLKVNVLPNIQWFYINWLSIGNSEKYSVNLTDVKYAKYTDVCFDIYFETASAKASLFDFNNVSTGVNANSWVTVEMPKESFNNGNVTYMAMWAEDPVIAVYIDNVRLKEFCPKKYDFENGDLGGEFGSNFGTVSVATDPENENNKVLLWNATSQWSGLLFYKFNHTYLRSEKYDAYKSVTLRIYITTDAANVTQIDSLTAFGVSKGSVETNKWITVTVSLEDARKESDAQIALWDSNLKGYTVYIDDIGVV